MNDLLIRYWPFFLCISVVILLRLFRPIIKGYLGELTIRFLLRFLNKKEYKTINNIRLFNNGIMAQIDHLVVSRYGIFVIETKNYRGWIFGSENAYQWTQVIFQRKYKFYNPIRQNLGHIKALQANLNQYPHLDYFPIVVFTRGSKLKVNSSFPVIKYYNLLRTIRNSTDINITEDERDNIFETLLRINGLKPLLIPKKVDFENPERNKLKMCPYCECELISRRGRYGNFLGCPNYPECDYTART